MSIPFSLYDFGGKNKSNKVLFIYNKNLSPFAFSTLFKGLYLLFFLWPTRFHDSRTMVICICRKKNYLNTLSPYLKKKHVAHCVASNGLRLLFTSFILLRYYTAQYLYFPFIWVFKLFSLFNCTILVEEQISQWGAIIVS